MSSPTSSPKFFGLDPHLLWREISGAWEPVLQSRYLSWLTPAFPVRVLRADRSEASWRGGRMEQRAEAWGRAEFEAIELAEDWVLRKHLPMPEMPEDAVREAVGLEVHSATPFAAGDLVWGHSALRSNTAGLLTVEVVLVSRTQANQYVESQRSRLRMLQEPEVWVIAASGSPIVLSGWGEHRRASKGVAHRRAACGLAVCAALLMAAIAVSPSLQLRARSLEAIEAYERLQRDTGSAVAEREVLTSSVDRLNALHDVLVTHADVLKVMAALTKTLPDDTYLQGLQVQGLKVTINGLTADSAALMQTLTSVPGFKEVKAPQAATRMAGASAENFRLEIQLDPAVFTATGSPSSPLPLSAAAGATSAATPPLSGASEARAPASAAAVPMTPASVPAQRKSRFTMGG